MKALLATIEKAKGNPQALVKCLDGGEKLISENLHVLENHEIRNGDCKTYIDGAILRAKWASSDPVLDALRVETLNFFENAKTEDLVLSKVIVYKLCATMTKRLLDSSTPIFGIPILLVAIQNLQKTKPYLTSLHVNICQLALAGKIFRPVLPLLDADILDVEPSPRFFSNRDAIHFFHYGGMIYAALKMWERSYRFFSTACSLPCNGAPLMLCATAKKLILVSLIYKGMFKIADYPVFRKWKVTGQITTFTKKFQFIDVYKMLEEAFAQPSPDKLREVISNYTEIFVNDGNFGLVKQLLDRHTKNAIQRLADVYLSLPLSDIPSKVKLDPLDSPEQQIVEMVAEKSISAKIDDQTGFVRFLKTNEEYDSPEFFASFMEKMKTTVNYVNQLRDANKGEIPLFPRISPFLTQDYQETIPIPKQTLLVRTSPKS